MEREAALVARHVGPIRSVEDRSWPHGVTRVLRWEAGGEVVWTKTHGQPRKFAQEAAAYAQLVPAMAAAGLRVPALVAAELPTLVLTHLPGEPAPADDAAVARQAGAALAVIHALPFDDPDPVPLEVALGQRMAHWAARAVGSLAPAEIADAQAGFDPAVFRGAQRVWCHRDWTARNWVIENGRLGILDFEHAAPDLWLFDWVKLAEGAFDERQVREAFVDGYGRFTLEAAEQLWRLLWLTALSTVAWAAAHGDADYETIGRRLLGRLRAGWRPASWVDTR